MTNVMAKSFLGTHPGVMMQNTHSLCFFIRFYSALFSTSLWRKELNAPLSSPPRLPIDAQQVEYSWFSELQKTPVRCDWIRHWCERWEGGEILKLWAIKPKQLIKGCCRKLCVHFKQCFSHAHSHSIHCVHKNIECRGCGHPIDAQIHTEIMFQHWALKRF